MEIVIIVVGIFLTIGLFILCRALVLWYWKLDKLDSIEEHLGAIRDSLSSIQIAKRQEINNEKGSDTSRWKA